MEFPDLHEALYDACEDTYQALRAAGETEYYAIEDVLEIFARLPIDRVDILTACQDGPS